jgi:hypothetical protein
MANEEIVKKDIVSEMKDMQDENDQSHLEPVNVVIGRYQPFTIGHLGMAKELEKINGLPSVYIYIRSKSGKNSKFTDKLTVNYMEDVVKGQDLVKDAWAMTASFIPVIVMETQRRGYNPVLIGAGEDRAKTYTGMAKRMKNITTHPDFKIQELKGRLTSATEVRQAITDGDEKKFKKLTPKQVHPYYKQLKDELEKTGELVESLSVSDIIDNYNTDIDIMESLLESYGADFFSDTLIIETILEGAMSDINIIFQDSKDFDEFKKEVKKEYPKLKDADILALYKDNEELMNESKVADEIESFLKTRFKKVGKTTNSGVTDFTGKEPKNKMPNWEGTLEITVGRDGLSSIEGMEDQVFKKDELFKEVTAITESELNEGLGATIKKAFKAIKKKVGMSKVVSPSDEQFKYAQDYLKKKFKGQGVELNGIGVDTVQDVIYLSYNATEFLEVDVTIPLPKELQESMNEKLKLKSDYPTYHHTFGSALDAISNYAESGGYKIDQQEFFTAFGDAFFKPRKGKTLSKSVELQDKNGNVVGVLHSSIYNRGVDGNTYELTMYSDQTKRGLRERVNEGEVQMSRRIFIKAIAPLMQRFKSQKAKQELYDLIKEFYGDHGITVFEHMLSKHEESINKAHTRIFEKVLMFKRREIELDAMDNRKERDCIPFLAKLSESKLETFKDYLTEMMGSADYEAKIDAAVCSLISTNRPVVWEDFKSSMIRSDFFKKEFRPFLMMQGLSDFQIDRFCDNIIRVKYQHYTNYFTGSIPLQYLNK